MKCHTKVSSQTKVTLWVRRSDYVEKRRFFFVLISRTEIINIFNNVINSYMKVASDKLLYKILTF